VRVFVSTGEASGELLAADLLGAMRAEVPALDADGIGGARLARAGVRILQSTAGWATLGIVDALRNIPSLAAQGVRIAARVRRGYDLVILVDFGAFNLRFAQLLRLTGSRTPILYYFPPAAWLDDR